VFRFLLRLLVGDESQPRGNGGWLRYFRRTKRGQERSPWIKVVEEERDSNVARKKLPVLPGLKRKEDGAISTTPEINAIITAFRRFGDENADYPALRRYLTTALGEVSVRGQKPTLDPGDDLIYGTTVAGWLANRLYNGRILHHGNEVSRWTDTPPIPDDLFERVQRRLTTFATTHAREAGRWPFRGIAKCGICGKGIREDSRPRRGEDATSTATRTGVTTFA
jgi:hypothetical protein